MIFGEDSTSFYNLKSAFFHIAHSVYNVSIISYYFMTNCTFFYYVFLVETKANSMFIGFVQTKDKNRPALTFFR